jgi:prefoldin subunit 5
LGVTELHRDIGRHDAQIEALQAQVDRLHGDMAKALSELQQINRTLSEARGGWRMLLAVGGLSSALTAGIIQLMGLFSGPK